MNDVEQEIIEYLIKKGALDLISVNEKGEPLYRFTPKIKEVMPALYQEHMTMINKSIMGLWEKGYLDLDLLSDNPTAHLTQKAINREGFDKLSDEELDNLSEIMRIFSE